MIIEADAREFMEAKHVRRSGLEIQISVESNQPKRDERSALMALPRIILMMSIKKKTLSLSLCFKDENRICAFSVPQQQMARTRSVLGSCG